MKRTLPWAAVALACLLSGAARSAEVPDEVREYVESRLPDLNAFVRVVTGYQATHLPRVEYRTPRELHLLAFGERGADAYAQCVETANVCVRAVAHGGVIFLSTAFKADGDDDDVLVHRQAI